MCLGADTSYNTGFPTLEDDECGWDASGLPTRYMKYYLSESA